MIMSDSSPHPVLAFLSNVGLFSLSLLHLLLTRVIPLLALLVASLLSQLFRTLLSFFNAPSTTKGSPPHKKTPSISSSPSSSSLSSSSISSSESEDELTAEEEEEEEQQVVEDAEAELFAARELEGLEEEESAAEEDVSPSYNYNINPSTEQQQQQSQEHLSAADQSEPASNPDAELYHDVDCYFAFDNRHSSRIMADTDPSLDQSNHTIDRDKSTMNDTPTYNRPRTLPPSFSDVERKLRQLRSNKEETTSN